MSDIKSSAEDMSGFTSKTEKHQKDILSFCIKILRGKQPAETVKNNRELIDTVNFRDVIWVVDEMVRQNIPMQELKSGINKILNLFYKSLSSLDIEAPDKNTFLWFLVENNREMESRLKAIRPLIKELNMDSSDENLIQRLQGKFKQLQLFCQHYVIKENILFPVIEKHWPDFRCVQVMWSFHDDIRSNIKSVLQILEQPVVDLEKFNSRSGQVFFNMFAIKFREERILFPLILETVPPEELENMLTVSMNFEWPFVKPNNKILKKSNKKNSRSNPEGVNLLTGSLLPEEIRLLINHLPLDITYVDENNKVRYFSTPDKRVFPRTTSIIGRDVRNCHPPESVHIVEEIIEAFRSGKQDDAKFWIDMGKSKLFIRYIAVRNEQGTYKGVLEVTQEITGIQKITGEKRLLDWSEGKG